MPSDDRYTDLIERIGKLKERRDQSAGALAELTKQLKEEYGLKSLDEARDELKRASREKKEADEKAEAEYRRIERLLDDAENTSST